MRDAPPYEQAYVQAYDANNSARTLAGSFLQKSHRLLERTLPAAGGIDRVLEVGAGTGHHLAFVARTFKEYVITDANDDMLAIAREKYAAELREGWLRIEKQNATALTYPD